MAWSTKLVCGSRELDLSDQWKIAEGGASFTPSKTVVSYGGMSPWQEGARRTSSFHENQEISLALNLRQQSGFATMTRIIRDLQQFFEEAKRNQEQGARDPVYLVRQADEGFTGTVLFGRGALYHEVLHGELNMPQSTYSTLLRGGTPSIVQSELNLTCMPFAVGKPTFCAEATGYVRFDTDNNLEIYGSASNFILNPGWENTNDFDAGWNAQDATISASVDRERFRNGLRAARVVNTGTSAAYYSACLTFANGSPYLLSGHVYLDGASNTANDVVLYAQGGSISTSMAAEAGSTGWTRLTGSFAGTGASAMYGIWEYSGKCATLDDFQIVSGSLVYPYFDGSLGPGLAWDGSSTCSQTTMTAGQWRQRTKWAFQPGYETVFFGKGTFSCWVKTSWAGNDGRLHYIVASQEAATTNRFLLYKSAANNLVFDIYGSTANGYKTLSFAVDATVWPADTWLFAVVQWDATGPTLLRLYTSSATITSDTSVATTGTWTAATKLGSYWYLGSDTSGTGQFNGTIADVRIFGPDAVVTVADLYTTGRGKSELGFLWTSAIGGSVQNTDDSTNKNYFYLANLPGDLESPIRLSISNGTTNTYDDIFVGFHDRNAHLYALNVFEGASAASAASVSDATRSSGSYVRVTLNTTTEPTGSHIGYRIFNEQPHMEDLVGRYRILASVRDNASQTGIYKLRATVNTNSNTLVAACTTNWVSADAVARWTNVDLGAVDIPPIPFQSSFDTQRYFGGYLSNLLDIGIRAWLSSGTGSTLEIDYIVLMPDQTAGKADDIANTLGEGWNITLDSISYPPRSYKGGFDSTDNNFPYPIPYERYEWVSHWPFIAPQIWVKGNILIDRSSGDTLPADSVVLSCIYQPRFLWGR